ncbi:MAG: TetR/AcrR family transcriptional regulator [Acidimicrobiales bacterium]
MNTEGPTLVGLMRAASVTDDDHGLVLDTALDAFLDFGIRRTTMGEIAKRAGISPATLYRRYAQKSDVVQSVGLREARRFLEGVDARLDPNADGESQVVDLFLAFLAGLRHNRLLGRLLVTEPEVVLPYLTINAGPVLDLGRAYLANFIQRLQAGGKIPAFDADPVAEMIARVSLSMVLTPQTCLPLTDESTARAFARDHIAVIFGL